ncbi:MAG: D-tyrosyl-tRNA(Tyr) deacylase [Alistipes sp.]|nr:D-tyrosyl-tRNA(Tyr) deacylase [Alistipes sp.]
MRLLIQRVTQARCDIGGRTHSAIESGLLVLVGVESSDNDEDIEWLARKLLSLRIFDDENGVMNRSVTDIGGRVMIVSQFTLMASTRRGNRPSWFRAAPEDVSRPMYERFAARVEELSGQEVATGCFGADMQISLTNDGPVTIWIDSHNRE